MSINRFTLASAQYDISFLSNWESYVDKMSHWVKQASDNDAKLLLFPEYFSMELASLFEPAVYQSLSRQLEAMQGLLPGFQRLFSILAQQYHLTIVAGSFPVQHADGHYTNRSYLFKPDGSNDYQDKLQMTRFENEQWHISAGLELKVLESPVGLLGICICYDSEFPMLARQQVERGANLILVPSCTDTLAGYNRVKIGSQARALENQCYVAQSVLVGQAPWSEAVDVNVGAAAVYTPVDYGYPPDGVLISGGLNHVQWVYAEVDLDSIAQVRSTGQVFNYRDWSSQFRPL